MGYLSNGECWPSVADASAAYYGASLPVQTVGTTTTLTMFAWTGSAWNLNKYSINASGAWSQVFSTAAPSLSFPVCDLPNDPTTSFLDGVTLGWGVVLAMAIAWGFREMKRTAK